MKTSTQKIIDDAMQLDPSARALVAETLLDSLDLDADFEVSEAWRTEIRRRCAEIRRGRDPDSRRPALAGLRAKYGQCPSAGSRRPGRGGRFGRPHRDKRRELARRFLNSLDEDLTRIEIRPHIHREVEPGVRKCQLKTFPFP